MNSVMGVATTKASHRLMEVARGTACPVTGGHAMRVTKGAWAKLCAKMRKSGIASGMGSLCSKPLHLPYNACLECKGKRIPAEVSIIDAAEVRVIEQQIIRRLEQAEQKKNGSDEMGTPKKRFDHCSLCGNKTNIFKNFGVEMCSNCANVTGHLSNRLPVVAKAAVRLEKHGDLLQGLVLHAGKPWFVKAMQQYLPTQVTVDLAKGPLDAIAELVGYIGEDTDGLVEMVGKMASENQRCAEQLEQMGNDGLEALRTISDKMVATEASIKEMMDVLRQVLGLSDDVPIAGIVEQVRLEVEDKRALREQLNASSGVLDTIATVVDAHGFRGEDVLLTVRHTAALLEHLARETNQIIGLKLDIPDILAYIDGLKDSSDQHSAFLLALRQELGLHVGPVGELLAAVKTKIELLEEYRSAINATTVAAEDAEQKLLADEQVFSRLREVLGDDSLANGDIPTAVAAMVSELSLAGPCPERQENHTLNSRLLSLLIDYPEVGVERIAEIMEVA